MIGVIVSLAMAWDRNPVLPTMHKGELVWVYDADSDMKVPMIVKDVYNDGSWNGRVAWAWGMA